MCLVWHISIEKMLEHAPEIQGQMHILRLTQTLVEIYIYQEHRVNLNLWQTAVIIPL